MSRHQIRAKVLSQERLDDETFILKALAPDIASTARPGQFCMVGTQPPNLHDPLLNRPLSIFDAQSDGAISFLYKVIGKGTKLLASKCLGAKICILGPLGRGFAIRADRPALLIGGGMGIAPLYFLAKAGKWKRPSAMLVGLPTYRGFQQLVNDLGQVVETLFVSTDDGTYGHKGLVTEMIDKGLSAVESGDDGQAPVIYCCGPRPMMKAVYLAAEETGLECQVSLEARMACGTGLCLGCATPKASGGYLHVCKEGPVTDAKEIKW